MVVDHTIIVRQGWAVGSASSFHHWDMSIKIHPTHVKIITLSTLQGVEITCEFSYFISSNILSPSIGCYEYLLCVIASGDEPKHSLEWCHCSNSEAHHQHHTYPSHGGQAGFRNLWSAALYLPMVSRESVSHNYFGLLKWKVRFSFPIGSWVCFKLSSYRDDQW